MPIFDYKCGICSHQEDDVFVHKYDDVMICPKCGYSMTKLISARVVGRCFPSEGIFLEHVSSTGQRFYSKKEMLAYEKKHSVHIDCAH